MAVEYEISSDVATITGVASNTQVANIVKFYTGSITYDDEPTSKYASVTINGKTQRVMLCVAVSGIVNYDDVPSLYSTVSGHRALNVVEPTESGTPDDVPSLYETVVVNGKTVRALRCVLINQTPNYDGISSTCTFTDNGKTHTAQLVNQVSSSSIETIVKGVSPLSLPDAVANSLQYVKAFGKTEQRNLPKGYIELEYIEASNESQYITTNIIPDWTTEIDSKFRTGNNKTFTVLSRWTNSPEADTFGVIVSSTSSNIVSYFGRYSDGLYQNDVSLRLNANQDVEYKLGQSSVKINTHTYSITRQNSGFENVLPLWIFKGNFLGEANNVDSTGSRVYSLKIKTQGALVFNGVPAKNASGVVGLYDKVSGQFLTNQGTGELIAGPAVTIPEEYTELEYIQSSGSQYIDTGIIGDNTLEITQASLTGLELEAKYSK